MNPVLRPHPIPEWLARVLELTYRLRARGATDCVCLPLPEPMAEHCPIHGLARLEEEDGREPDINNELAPQYRRSRRRPKSDDGRPGATLCEGGSPSAVPNE